MKAQRWRKEMLFLECSGDERGCREQLWRQRKGLHPSPTWKDCKCVYLGGVTSGLREGLAEAAGGLAGAGGAAKEEVDDGGASSCWVGTTRTPW